MKLSRKITTTESRPSSLIASKYHHSYASAPDDGCQTSSVTLEVTLNSECRFASIGYSIVGIGVESAFARNASDPASDFFQNL